MPDVHGLFQAALRSRGVDFSGPDADRRYRVASPHGDLQVSLDNLTRDLVRNTASLHAHAAAELDSPVPEAVCDANARALAEARVGRFVAALLAHVARPVWAAAEGFVYLAAEPADSPWGDAIHQRVTDSLSRVLVLTDAHEEAISWLTPGDLATWGVTEATAFATADRNLDRLLADTRLDVREVDGMRLAMLPLATIFKASVLFAPAFKALAQRDLDWPVLAVAPCRDFVYLLPETDSVLLERMGTVVQREFHTSGYPVTTEVLRLSDDGAEAIGRYAD